MQLYYAKNPPFDLSNGCYEPFPPGIPLTNGLWLNRWIRWRLDIIVDPAPGALQTL